MTDNAIVIANTGNNFLAPATGLDIIRATYQAKKEFIEAVLKEGVDYGTIPGSAKPALLKPGAEKMTSFFGLSPVFEDAQTVEDWSGADHNGEQFFYYRQRCKLYSGSRLIASADGSCNSWEKKYRYRWVGEAEVPAHLDKSKLKQRGGRISEFTFSIDKAETTGKYAKPASYWKQFKDAIANGTATKIQKTTASGKTFDAWEIGSSLYCIPNDEVSDIVNTILKMAQKRALVAATLIATNVSDYFTQDIEDYADPSTVDAVFYDATPAPVTVTQPPAPVPTLKPLTPLVPVTPAPQAEATPEGMTLEQAMNFKTSDTGELYGSMPTEKLALMANAITKKLRGDKPGTDEQQEVSRNKHAAITMILAHRDAKPA